MFRKILLFVFYPNINSVTLVYLLQRFRNQKNKLLSLLIWNKLIKRYGIHVGNGSKIKKGLILPHPLSVVIGQGVTIGENCIIYHNVTLGTKHSVDSKSTTYPKIGNNVIIYTNSIILGGVTIGDNTIIGANSFVTHDLEPNSIYAGYPLKKLL